MRVRWFTSLAWLAGVLLLPLAATTAEPKVILRADFQKDPAATGWAFRGRAPGPDIAPWTTDPVDANNHVIAARRCGHTEGWTSAPVRIQPGEYYHLTFRYRTPARAYVAAIFNDPNGIEIQPDHYSCVDPCDTWTNGEFYFRAKAMAAAVKLRFRGIESGVLYVDDVSLTAATHAQTAAWCDHVYAQLPPLKYVPPADRWKGIGPAIAKLRKGGPVRIVMLGDSIVNDTGNSNYGTLLDRAYPKAKIEIITSVRGGTGCWYYRQPGRVQAYVLDYRPDLVIIGGVCNRRASAVGAVIEQIRAKSDVPILVMSGAYGEDYQPPHSEKTWPYAKIHYRYRDGLKDLMAEMGVEFLDMRAATDEYFDSCGHDMSWYMRDQTHPNERGRQIIGRVLLRYLSPDKPAK